MKKNLLTKLLVVLVVMTLVFSVTACDKKVDDPNADGSSTTDNTGETVGTDEEVTLKMITWVQETNELALAALNEAFMAKYPNVTIVVDTVGANDYPTLLNTRLAAEDVDIVTNLSAFDALPQDFTIGSSEPAWETFVKSGAYVDITDEAFIANWDQGMIQNAVSYEGRVYGLDMGAVGFNGLFYNKAIFDEYDFEEPGTWDEFVAICETLQENGIAPVTLGGQDVWPLTAIGVSGFVGANVEDMTAYAQGLWEGTRTFTDEESMKIWTRLEQFVSYLEPNVMSVSYGDAPGRLVSGKAAMMYDGTWNAGTIAALDPEFEFGYFCVPGDVDGNPNQLQGKYDMQFNLVASSEHVDWGLKYFEFLSQPENYGPFVDVLGFFPTMPGIESSNEFVQSIADKNTGFSPAWEKVIVPPKGIGQYFGGLGFVVSHLEELGGTVATIEELAQLTQEDWDAAVQAAKDAAN